MTDQIPLRDGAKLPSNYRESQTIDFKKDRKFAIAIQAIFVAIAVMAVIIPLLFSVRLGTTWSPILTIPATFLAALIYMAVHEATHGVMLHESDALVSSAVSLPDNRQSCLSHTTKHSDRCPCTRRAVGRGAVSSAPDNPGRLSVNRIHPPGLEFRRIVRRLRGDIRCRAAAAQCHGEGRRKQDTCLPSPAPLTEEVTVCHEAVHAPERDASTRLEVDDHRYPGTRCPGCAGVKDGADTPPGYGKVDDTFFIAESPLHDGQGNPPPGWGNPYQAGTVTISGSQAVFEDDDGHAVTFVARPGATGFVKTCS